MTKRTHFDSNAFYAALDSTRRSRNKTWKDVADDTGVSASTLTRMAQGSGVDVNGLAALTSWAGLDADTFFVSQEPRRDPEPLAMISTYLKMDKNLSKEAATALDELVKAAYGQMRNRDGS